MTLENFKKLISLGYITNVYLVDYYTSHTDELEQISIDEMLKKQGGGPIFSHNITDEPIIASVEPVENISTVVVEPIITPVEPIITPVEPIITPVEPIENIVDDLVITPITEDDEIVVDDGEDLDE